MINPGAIMKAMAIKDKFTNAHPKFVAFLKTIAANGLSEGDVVEVTITHNGSPITANMKVTADDLQMIEDLKGLK